MQRMWLWGVVVVSAVCALIASAEYASLALYDTCGDFRLDFVLLQDASWSFRHDLPVVKKQLREILTGLEVNFPGSRFGVTTFTDKPAKPLGTYEDWCYKLVTPLTQDIDMLIQNFNETEFGFGGDMLEAQLDAMKYTLIDTRVGWDTWDDALPYKPTIRVMALSTDMDYHFATDYDPAITDWVQYWAEQGISIDPMCVETTYPTFNEMIGLMQKYNAVPVFLLQNPADELGYWRMLDMFETGGTVRRVDTNSTDLTEAIVSSMNYVSCEALQYRTSTTTSTTTSTIITTSTLTTTITSTTTSTTTTTTAGLPVGAVVGAAVGLVVLIGALAAGGVFYYNRNSSPDGEDRQFGDPELVGGDVMLDERDEMAPVNPADFA